MSEFMSGISKSDPLGQRQYDVRVGARIAVDALEKIASGESENPRREAFEALRKIYSGT